MPKTVAFDFVNSHCVEFKRHLPKGIVASYVLGVVWGFKRRICVFWRGGEYIFIFILLLALLYL